jgi:hypothetical protein
MVMTTACGSTVATEGGEPAATTSEPPSTPTSTPAIGATSCSTLAAEQPLMVFMGDESASILRNDGTRIELGIGAELLPADGHRTVVALAHGQSVVTFARSLKVGGPIEANSIVTMFDQNGSMLWRLEGDGYEASGLALDDDGRLLMARYFYQGDGDVVLVKDGLIDELPPHVTQVIGWASSGVIRARIDGVPGFHDVVTTSDAVVMQPELAVFVRPWARGYLNLQAGKSAPWLFRETALGNDVAVLWDIDEPADNLQLSDASESHAILHSTESNRRWWVDVFSGQSIELPTTTPMGAPPDSMEYCSPPPTLASDGSVVMVGGQDALFFQTVQPSQEQWATLGEPVAEVELVDVGERDGTFLLQGVVGTFCPGPVGTDPTALAGESLQVVRPSSDVAMVVDGFGASVRQGGACVAYQTQDGVHVLDLPMGRDSYVGDLGTFESGYRWWTQP